MIAPGVVAGGYRVASGAGGGEVTWNPLDKSSNISLSAGNLTASKSAITHDGSMRATVGKSAGKWYWEVRSDNNGAGNSGEYGGIAKATAPLTTFIGGSSDSWGYLNVNGSKYNGAAGTSYGATQTTGDIIGVALDMDDGKVWFSKNGVWQASGVPADGTNAAFSGLSGTIYPAAGLYDDATSLTARFKASEQSYSAPSGFSAIGGS